MRYLRRYYHSFWPHSHSTDTTAASCLCYQLSCKSAPTGKAEAKRETDTFLLVAYQWARNFAGDVCRVIESLLDFFFLFFSLFAFGSQKLRSWWETMGCCYTLRHQMKKRTTKSTEQRDISLCSGSDCLLERKWGVSTGSWSPPVS